MKRADCEISTPGSFRGVGLCHSGDKPLLATPLAFMVLQESVVNTQAPFGELIIQVMISKERSRGKLIAFAK